MDILNIFGFNPNSNNELPCPTYTTTERDALTGTLKGRMIYNSTTSTFQIYNGSTWVEVGGGSTSFASAAEVLARTVSNKAIAPNNLDGGVKRYKATLNQSGTNAPTPTILENSFGEVPTLTRSGAGDFRVSTVAELYGVESKVFITFQPRNQTGGIATNFLIFDHSIASEKQIALKTIDVDLTSASSTETDGLMENAELLIEVYP